ncbi:MAG: KH domain-containing protein [Elusimicrobia bacterium]|nr:KH domain-containing protein [Elusimicrobiota bacterium]
MKEMAIFMLKSLTLGKEINMTERIEGESIYLSTKVAPEDKGKVIGKDGCIIRAMRTVLSAAGSKQNKKVFLKIED